MAVAQLAQQAHARRGVEAHPARALHDGLDDDAGQLVGVALDERRHASAHAGSSGASKPSGGRSAKTCSASAPVNRRCIPPSGSHTAIAPNVSPW